MQYVDREAVEVTRCCGRDLKYSFESSTLFQVRFELEGQGPSWWEGNIKGARITNDPPSYLVTFDDAEYTNTFSTQIIRKAAGVPRMTLKKAVLPIPHKVAVHADISKLDSAGRLFCLRLTKDSMGSDCVTVIGYPDDVDRLCEPDCLRFHLVQLEKMADYVRMPASHAAALHVVTRGLRS